MAQMVPLRDRRAVRLEMEPEEERRLPLDRKPAGRLGLSG